MPISFIVAFFVYAIERNRRTVYVAAITSPPGGQYAIPHTDMKLVKQLRALTYSWCSVGVQPCLVMVCLSQICSLKLVLQSLVIGTCGQQTVYDLYSWFLCQPRPSSAFCSTWKLLQSTTEQCSLSVLVEIWLPDRLKAASCQIPGCQHTYTAETYGELVALPYLLYICICTSCHMSITPFRFTRSTCLVSRVQTVE